MKPKLKKWPMWMQRALQGVTYWMGHRRCLYRDYPLSEGALVAEVCNLIYANLPERLQLLCEIQYSSFLTATPMPNILRGKIRVDLAVAEKLDAGTLSDPKFIIEVKRASAPMAQITDDLRRLATARRLRPEMRAFLFVISEAKLPSKFVHEEGKSLPGEHRIKGSRDYYRVRRTWKAAHAFKNRKTAQYACLIEVYPNK